MAAASDKPRLGPFELKEPIAKGGMGEVWSARHVGEDLEVAIKVITADFARHPGFQASLRHEIRAMATLSHPHIVRVLDQGEIDGEAARRTEYQLVEGSPYIAMEMVNGGTLADHVLGLKWSDVRDILVKLLGALGHAHARRVLHRDLKPANLLLAAGGTTWDLKLTDFGIAHPLFAAQREGPRVAGTPHFMAPEQQAGEWRRYRPATDLFSVGRIASALLERDEEGRAMVPRGFNRWMAKILADEPQHRFILAADAAHALRQMGEPTAVLDPAFMPGKPPTKTRTENQTLVFVDPSEPERTLGDAAIDDMDEVPPIPRSWRMAIPRPPTRQMKNAGAGLFGIRNIELVGRPEERNALWKLLHRVAAERRVHVLLVRGPDGIGKASLLRWFRRRAHEVGAALPHHAVFSPFADGGSPLTDMFADSLSTRGLTHGEAAGYVRRICEIFGAGEYEQQALLELTNPAPEDESSVFRFRSAEEREVATCRLLEWNARRRPVMLHFDHVHWGGDGLRVVLRALERAHSERRPLLFLLTTDEKNLAISPNERKLLDEVRERAGIRFRELALGPLPPSAQRALIASLLGLDPALVAQIAEQTQGRPLHAVQLVKKLQEEGQLQEGFAGLQLARGSTVRSESVGELWGARLAQFMEDHTEESQVALELMATLGPQVTENDWARLCRRAGVRLTRRLVDGLLTAGLLRARSPKLYQFAHPSLRTTITEYARRHGRLEAHHQNCAELVRLHGRSPHRHGLIGQHLLSGGRPRAALEFLYRGVIRAVDEAATGRARELLALWQRALDALDPPGSDPLHGDGYYMRSRLAMVLFDVDEARREFRTLEKLAKQHDWPKHLARAVALAAQLAHQLGDASESLRLLPRAINLADQAQDRITSARTRLEMAQVLNQQGMPKAAAPWIAEARKVYEQDKVPIGEANCLLLSASIAFNAGRFDEALGVAEAARHMGAKAGALTIQGFAMSIIGEVHRKSGRPDMARRAYHRALSMFHGVGAEAHGIPCELNLALLHQEDAEDDAAIEILTACIERLHRTRRSGLEAIAHCLLLPSLAAQRNDVAFERHLTRGAELFDSTGYRDPDAIIALHQSVRIARRLGWNQLADRAQELAENME